MDPPGPGRYGLQQGWDNNSALEGYAAYHDPHFRAGDSYDERRYKDEKYPRGNFYQRDAFHHDIMDRDGHPSSGPSAVSHWTQSKRRGYKEDYALDREYRHPDRPYHDPYYHSDAYRDRERDRYSEFGRFQDGYGGPENHGDRGYDQPSHFRGHDRDDYAYDDYEYRSRSSHRRRDGSLESDYDHSRLSYDSDYERGSRRDSNWRQRDSRDRERDTRCSSRDTDSSAHRRRDKSRSQSHSRSRSRSHSHGYDDLPRSRSPQARSYREDGYSDSRSWRSEKRRDREEKRHRGHSSVAPSATVVVKGLSQKTTEEDLYQILAEWGPLQHVRVIRERNSGISRGFAFIDFPSLEAALAMMDKLGDDGLIVDGRKLFFEYSSKPTGGPSGPFAQESGMKSVHNHKSVTMPSDWRCTICDYINFARRTSCYQCNEPRSDDAPPADISSSYSAALGKKGSEAGPSHVLVVRGLDENADEEMLRYEFSKHAPIKDLRLVRDKFTHVSRGFAFVHFYSVEDATKALEATNGITLEKNGQILRVAYAKSTLGPGGTSASQSSSLAAAAIEAAAFAQQYDSFGWAPKEYNPDDKTQIAGQPQSNAGAAAQKDGMAPQSGFVWDEASGYYYDAASGFYYDGNTGLYYDGNNGTWYSYDHQTQQYIPYTDQSSNKTPGNQSELKVSDSSNTKKAVISAPATTVSGEKPASLADAVQAAAAAAIAAEKKEKDKLKEIKLASRSSILANKKKMSNVLTMWKQRSYEGQATRVALDENQTSASADAKPFSTGHSAKTKCRSEVMSVKENNNPDSGFTSTVSSAPNSLESEVKPQPVSNSLGGTLMGVIRGSGRGVIKSEASYCASTNTAACTSDSSSTYSASSTTSTPFKTDVSALGSYGPSMANGSGKRRFSETPASSMSTSREQPQTYRDRAAERRTLYGSSSSVGDDISDFEFQDSTRDPATRKGSGDMPFPPGVGGGRVYGEADIDNYEVITADKAIDESNVGNRMLRSMGWHEGLGLGKDGSGLTEPVQAQGMESRAGLGSQKKRVDPSLEVQPGDSYKTLIHKKALARFREMS